MNTMKWLLKREYWEHKGGFLWAPIVVAAFIGLLSIGSMLFGAIAGNNKGIFHSNGSDFTSALVSVVLPVEVPPATRMLRRSATAWRRIASWSADMISAAT